MPTSETKIAGRPIVIERPRENGRRRIRRGAEPIGACWPIATGRGRRRIWFVRMMTGEEYEVDSLEGVRQAADRPSEISKRAMRQRGVSWIGLERRLREILREVRRDEQGPRVALVRVAHALDAYTGRGPALEPGAALELIGSELATQLEDDELERYATTAVRGGR